MSPIAGVIGMSHSAWPFKNWRSNIGNRVFWIQNFLYFTFCTCMGAFMHLTVSNRSTSYYPLIASFEPSIRRGKEGVSLLSILSALRLALWVWEAMGSEILWLVQGHPVCKEEETWNLYWPQVPVFFSVIEIAAVAFFRFT
jgi:hypothetical protein